MSAALCLAVELSLFCLVLFTEWKSSKVLAQSLQSTNHSPLFNQTDRKRPTRMYYQVGSCLYSCNHNLLLRKRLWPQSMVSITVPVLHQSHISVRKIYKNKWKILLFQVFLDFLLVIIVHKEDGKETFVLFLELRCTFAKVGSHLQSYIFIIILMKFILPGILRNATQLYIVQTFVFIWYYMILYYLVLKLWHHYHCLPLKSNKEKLSFFHIEYFVSGKPNNLLAQFVALQGSKAETVVAVQR